MNAFINTLNEHRISLSRRSINILQVNIGKLCNQACTHCHVEAGPKRPENMTRETVDRLLELLALEPQIHTVDITGGAPELNPHFRHFVLGIRALGKQVIDRCNLTVLFEPQQEDTAKFLAGNQVQIVASLPCYKEDNVDKQRGRGVFDKSINGLLQLNDLGYGKPDTGLSLTLVYNPVGEHLPPAQAQLEADYHGHLESTFGIVFNNLFTITNMPIKRYAHALQRDGKLKDYMRLLAENFNSDAANNVMCANLVSIGWDGKIYDCDFNQMLEMPINDKRKDIWQVDKISDITSEIVVANHCYGCTAGAGSSCGGALT